MRKKDLEELVRLLNRGYDESGFGCKDITSAGTPERITDQDIKTAQILFQAKPANTGYIYIGFDENMSSTRYGACLSAESIVVIPINNLNKVWIDSSVNGEGLSYIALV